MPVRKRIWAILPAAGIGRRMEAEIPKQYLPLAGKCVIEHTLDALCGCSQFSGIVAAVAETDPHWPELNLNNRYGITQVRGGNERAESVLNAIDALVPEATDDDWALVHDAVRPCLDPRDLQALVTAALDSEHGAILAVRARDTIKRVRENRIYETVPREDLWHAQTPQMFPLLQLHQALQGARADGVSVTDESQAMELEGYQPQVVEGRSDNIKITRPEDLQQAARCLARITTNPG